MMSNIRFLSRVIEVRAVNQECDLDSGVEVASGEINFEFGLLL